MSKLMTSLLDMNEELFSVECDEGECTIWFKKPYTVDILKEEQYVIVMEIGYKEDEKTANEYYFTKDEAVAMAEKICVDLEREYKEREERVIRELNDGTWKNFEP